MHQVLDRLVGIGMPVWFGCLVRPQPLESCPYSRTQLGTHEAVRLGNAEGRVQSGNDSGALKVFGFGSQFKDALEWRQVIM